MAMFLQLFLLTGMSLLEVIYGRNASTAFCSKTLTGFRGSLSSPEDDIILSSKNLDCQYDINVGAGNAVWLRWTKFKLNGKMPSCLENYVEIFIGCGRHSIGRYCSNHLDCLKESCIGDFFDVYSPDSCLRIIYHTSDSYDGKGGIGASYEAISRSSGKQVEKVEYHRHSYRSTFFPPDECDRNKEEGYFGYGHILSPQWPLSYPPSQDCYWRINTKKPSKKTYRIIFMDFNLTYDAGCHDDTVTIRGGDESQPYSALTAINGPMCGQRNPFFLTVTAERVWLRFKSDGSGNGSFAVGIYAYEDTSLSGGAVAGIVVSIIAFLAFVGCLVVYLRRRARRKSDQLQRTAAVRDEQVAVTRRAAARRAASPPPQQSNTPPPKRQGEQRQTTAAVHVATQRAAEHHPPPSAPPPTSNASSPPQQRRNTPSAPPPEPDYAPPSYSQIMAKAYPK